jgi:hypothetical protein
MSILIIHPIIQVCGIILVVVTFTSGLQRFRSLHLMQHVRFPRKRHIRVGKIALITLLAGAMIGLSMVRYHWGHNLMTMGHGKMGLILLTLLIPGLISGWILATGQKHSLLLKAFHGAINTLLLLLALNQVQTGFKVLQMFVFDL